MSEAAKSVFHAHKYRLAQCNCHTDGNISELHFRFITHMLKLLLQNPCCWSNKAFSVFLFVEPFRDQFAFPCLFSRLILQVGLSMSILYQAQGWDHDSFTANVQKHALRHNPSCFECLHVLQLFPSKNFTFNSIPISLLSHVFEMTVKSVHLQHHMTPSAKVCTSCTSAAEMTEHLLDKCPEE